MLDRGSEPAQAGAHHTWWVAYKVETHIKLSHISIIILCILHIALLPLVCTATAMLFAMIHQ